MMTGDRLIARLTELVKEGRYDIVIIDPLMEALPVEDENNNTQANEQLWVLKKLARSTGAAVVAVHNSGLQKKRRGKFLGRGATARVDRADVSINFTATSETGRSLKIVKTRGQNLNEEFQVEFAEDFGYKLLSSSSPDPTLEIDYQVKLIEIARDEAKQGRTEFPRKMFLDRLGILDRSAQSQAMDRALLRNLANGEFVRPKKDVYVFREGVESSLSEARQEVNLVA